MSTGFSRSDSCMGIVLDGRLKFSLDCRADLDLMLRSGGLHARPKYLIQDNCCTSIVTV